MRVKEGTFILIVDHIPVKNQVFNFCGEVFQTGLLADGIINIYNELQGDEENKNL